MQAGMWNVKHCRTSAHHLTVLVDCMSIASGSVSEVLTCEFSASHCSPSPHPPDPVLYEKALAEQERRAHSIVYGMSAGVYTKLLRLVMCPPGWSLIHIHLAMSCCTGWLVMCPPNRSPSIWLLYCPALLPLHFVFQPLRMDVLCSTFSLLLSQRLPPPFFPSLLTPLSPFSFHLSPLLPLFLPSPDSLASCCSGYLVDCSTGCVCRKDT